MLFFYNIFKPILNSIMKENYIRIINYLFYTLKYKCKKMLVTYSENF